MDFRHLRYFIVAAETGSFRRAAAALGVQESSVSRRIRDIEDQTGASLFVRHHGGINLTMAGQRFLHRARHALEHIREGAAEVAAIGRAEGGYLRVGLFSSLSSGFLSALFNQYDLRHQSVHIDFVEGEAHEHINSLRQFRMDIAFVIEMADFADCYASHLWSEPVFVALPQSHRLAYSEALTWKELDAEKILLRDTPAAGRIEDYVVHRMREAGGAPLIEAQRVGRYKLLNLVSAGRGLTLIIESESLVKIPGVIYRPLNGEAVSFHAAWAPKNDNPALQTLLSLARTMARDRMAAPSTPLNLKPSAALSRRPDPSR
ncbi:LysR family transcriptional regulator [Xanthobacter sp. YC-JY1]|nr:LysR family transcriptional regulator [Xanthobacter sp. YC-JY1]